MTLDAATLQQLALQQSLGSGGNNSALIRAMLASPQQPQMQFGARSIEEGLAKMLANFMAKRQAAAVNERREAVLNDILQRQEAAQRARISILKDVEAKTGVPLSVLITQDASTINTLIGNTYKDHEFARKGYLALEANKGNVEAQALLVGNNVGNSEFTNQLGRNFSINPLKYELHANNAGELTSKQASPVDRMIFSQITGHKPNEIPDVEDVAKDAASINKSNVDIKFDESDRNKRNIGLGIKNNQDQATLDQTNAGIERTNAIQALFSDPNFYNQDKKEVLRQIMMTTNDPKPLLNMLMDEDKLKAYEKQKFVQPSKEQRQGLEFTDVYSVVNPIKDALGTYNQFVNTPQSQRDPAATRAQLGQNLQPLGQIGGSILNSTGNSMVNLGGSKQAFQSLPQLLGMPEGPIKSQGFGFVDMTPLGPAVRNMQTMQDILFRQQEENQR